MSRTPTSSTTKAIIPPIEPLVLPQLDSAAKRDTQRAVLEDRARAVRHFHVLTTLIGETVASGPQDGTILSQKEWLVIIELLEGIGYDLDSTDSRERALESGRLLEERAGMAHRKEERVSVEQRTNADAPIYTAAMARLAPKKDEEA